MKIKDNKSFSFLPAVFVSLAAASLLVAYGIYQTSLPPKPEEPPPSAPVFIPASDFRGLQKIRLTVDSVAYQKLADKRDTALVKNILLGGEDDFVPAVINFSDTETEAEIRLKGDWTDHLTGDKWSFRVKLPSDRALLGMRKFSLHRPEARNSAGEWLFHALLADAGILNLQYHFVELELLIKHADEIKTKNLGIYALEEAFSKHLLERNQRREGVILKLDENRMWEERAELLELDLPIELESKIGNATQENLPVIPFEEKKMMTDPALRGQLQAGLSLFTDYLLNDKKISEVTDTELTAKYNAIANLLGANHGLIPHNYRFYYNAVTARLEPVGFDGNAGIREDFPYIYLHGKSDPEYMRAYGAALTEVTSDEYFERVQNYPGLAEAVKILQAENPDYQWNKSNVRYNRRVLQKLIRPSRTLKVYFNEIKENYIHLSVENYGRLPVEIDNLRRKDGRYFTVNQKPIYVPKGITDVILPLDKGYRQIFTDIKKKKVGFDARTDFSDTELVYRGAGVPDERTEGIMPWQRKTRRNQVFSPRKYNADSLVKFPFLEVDKQALTVTVPAGRHRVRGPMVVPEPYRLIIEPGAELNLSAFGSAIVSYGAMTAEGTADRPIKIFAETDWGQGVAVLAARDTSRLSYVTFENLSNPARYAWLLSGAVNFYQSPVMMKRCAFKNNRCEDALNIIRTYADMDELVFSGTLSDAFDGDFMHGNLRNSAFAAIGNDAIDISGSRLEIRNTQITRVGDKGISAGEDSRVNAFNVTVKNSEIAVAAKDKSVLTLKNCTFTDNTLTYTAFQKKPEYGTASIIADDCESRNSDYEHLIEIGSSLLLNGQSVETVREVKGRMYGIEFGAATE